MVINTNVGPLKVEKMYLNHFISGNTSEIDGQNYNC
jgi:hypothetical protein